jgi:predicted regulator of amino acid metabolism with ACT domain
LDGSYGLRIHSHNAQKILTKIIDIFSKNSIKIESIIINSPSLEEVFLDVINKNK